MISSFRKLNLKCTKLFHLGPNLFSKTLFVTELTLSGQDFNLIKGHLHLKNNFNWTQNKEENSAPLKSISFQVYLDIRFLSGLGLCVLSFKNYWMALGNKRNWALFLGRQHSPFKPFHDPTCESVPTFGCLLLHFSPRLLLTYLHLWWTQHIKNEPGWPQTVFLRDNLQTREGEHQDKTPVCPWVVRARKKGLEGAAQFLMRGHGLKCLCQFHSPNHFHLSGLEVVLDSALQRAVGQIK